jgi:predicted enzyme related to lactoylglutathione lyase
MKGPGYEPSENGTVVYFTCPDMDETIARAEKSGSKVTLLKKDLGKWGTITWLTDSEGNTFALHKAREAGTLL